MLNSSNYTPSNFELKLELMEGLSIIESNTLKEWKEQFNTLQQNQLLLIKMVQNLLPTIKHSNVPDFISIEDACKKYHLSRVSINNKIQLFKKANKRPIDRMQSGNYFLINEFELQEAIKIKGIYKLRQDNSLKE